MGFSFLSFQPLLVVFRVFNGFLVAFKVQFKDGVASLLLAPVVKLWLLLQLEK